jgi:hypothetical protein
VDTFTGGDIEIEQVFFSPARFKHDCFVRARGFKATVTLTLLTDVTVANVARSSVSVGHNCKSNALPALKKCQVDGSC